MNAPTGSDVYISDLGLDVSRKFLGDSFSYANVYSFDFEGIIYDSAFADGKLSVALENRIRTIAANGKFNHKIKSISFPSTAGDSSDNLRFSKFSMSVEFQEKTSDYNRFALNTGGNDFTNLMPTIIESSGEFIKELSETFDFNENEGGEGKFSHSVNFTLLPVTGNSINGLIQSNHLQNAARSIITNFTNYSTFVSIAKLFTGQGFYFNNSFFAQHTGRMIHSETVDLLANSYSLSRSKTYYTGYNEFYCFDHNYNLSVASDGSVEISEETKMEGETNYADLISKFNEVEVTVAQVTNGSNTFSNVKASYNRCSQFLNTYHKFLRLRKTESDAATYFPHYTNSTSLYSLKPFPIEKTLTSIPELPSLIYNIKYTTSPNINFGYESNEEVKAKKNGTVFDVSYTAGVKVFNFQTGDFSSFDSSLGNQPGIANFSNLVNDVTNGLIKKSSVFVHELVNDTNKEVSLHKLRPDANNIPLALVKKGSSISRRGKDFNLTLEYSSDNKYAPLYYNQDPNVTYGASYAPDKGKMFENLIIPPTVRDFLAQNFTFIDKKINITIPVEKFTQRIVLARPQGVAIIEPSVQSSTGKMSISFNMKINKKNYSFFEGGVVTLFGGSGASTKYVTYLRTLISDLFSTTGSNFSPIFHSTVSSEIEKVIDINGTGGVHSINGYVPTSINYKFDSDFNLEISVEVEFYSKSQNSKRKPIFGFRGNKDYGVNVNQTSSLFGQGGSY